jgi:hypothetical protein
MSLWLDLLTQFRGPIGYLRGGIAHTEPTAVASLAMLAWEPARYQERLLRNQAWLAERQLPDGSIAPNEELTEPGWGTSWALLERAARRACTNLNSKLMRGTTDSDLSSVKTINSPQALAWLLSISGVTMERSPSMGHDSTLLGWPWVNSTHTWLEPTCLAVMALKAHGYAAHPRYIEGIRVIQDRLLPRGGANYGNTFVLGQQLLPHLQPTGLALMALAGTTDESGLQARAREYLLRDLPFLPGAASLAFGILGLHAQGYELPEASRLLQDAAARVLRRDTSPYRLALLCWAAWAIEQPLGTIWPGNILRTTSLAEVTS